MIKFIISLVLVATPFAAQAQFAQPYSAPSAPAAAAPSSAAPEVCNPSDMDRLNRTMQIGGDVVYDPHYWIQTINRRVETPRSLYGIVVCAGRQAEGFALEAQSQTGQARLDSLRAAEGSRAIMVAVGEAIKYVTGHPNRVHEYPERRRR